MIKELVQFTNYTYQEFGNEGLSPTEGLHLFVSLNETGLAYLTNSEFYDSKKQPEISDMLETSITLKMNSDYISMNKALDNKKKIHSCSPFVMAFKYKEIKAAKERVRDYFKTAKRLFLKEELELISKSEKLEIYCQEQLFLDLKEIIIPIKERARKGDVEIKSYHVNQLLKDNHYISIYLVNVSLEEYASVHSRYLLANLFNSDEGKQQVDETTYGISGYLNGYNSKKPFLYHKTATFQEGISSRISQQETDALYKFERLLSKNKVLPNPLPIFIYDDELNKIPVRLHSKEGKKSYSEIIKHLFELHNRSKINNYYLLNFQLGKLQDIDFVSSFRYELDWKILNLFEIGSKEKGLLPTEKIKTIFDFERLIVHTIFNNSLVQYSPKKDSYSLKYFGELEQQYCDSNNNVIYNLILKYRQAFYDFIYKSRENAISADSFNEILLQGILKDISRDEERKSTSFIKRKLNIWFSLTHHFKNDSSLLKNYNMPQKLNELLDKMRALCQDNTSIAQLESHEEFAFATGQAIYYLLDLSRSDRKSHALLEPFIQRYNPDSLKQELGRTFIKYSHEMRFGKGRIERLMSHIHAYPIQENMQKYLPFLLSGYFAKSVIYEKSEAGVSV